MNPWDFTDSDRIEGLERDLKNWQQEYDELGRELDETKAILKHTTELLACAELREQYWKRVAQAANTGSTRETPPGNDITPGSLRGNKAAALHRLPELAPVPTKEPREVL